MSKNIEELESLLFEWEADGLEENEVLRVREILSSDAKAREFFVQQQMISAALKLDGDAGLPASVVVQSEEKSVDAEPAGVGPSKTASNKSRSVGFFRMSFWMAAAASLLICLLAGRVLYLEIADEKSVLGEVAVVEAVPRNESDEATSEGVAIVTRLVDIQWDAEQVPLEVGDAVVPGSLAITSGFVQVEFFCGATVVLEGPAELDLKSATLARVRSGRLRAQVPPAARGFSLEVDDMKVVDLGTEFGLSVSPEGASLQVFDGEVELQDADHEKQLLTAGHGLSRDDQGEFAEVEITPDKFVDIATLESRASGQQAVRHEQWKAWSGKVKKDPRLITYYAFDQQDGWSRRLTSSIEPANSELDGAIVGARRVEGRWPGKGGLEFKRPGDRVRVQIPGEFGSLTLSCWVKIDSLDRWYNSLFLTDNYNQGEPHWQILDTGQMYFSVRPTEQGEKGPHDHKVLSPPFWKASMSGKWLHLATTYDVENKQATHYLNGEVLHTETIPDVKLVKATRIGTASIGNWSLPTIADSQFAIRNLNGSIDEFAMFAAALTSDEIKEMYENGKP